MSSLLELIPFEVDQSMYPVLMLAVLLVIKLIKMRTTGNIMDEIDAN
jgi:hypothetical protein